MTQQPIRFTDGEAYERGMGPWSQLVGQVFLDWLAPRSGLRWIDIGCGNGAFTELLLQRCAPVEAQGIDPSEDGIVLGLYRETGVDAGPPYFRCTSPTTSSTVRSALTSIEQVAPTPWLSVRPQPAGTPMRPDWPE